MLWNILGHWNEILCSLEVFEQFLTCFRLCWWWLHQSFPLCCCHKLSFCKHSNITCTSCITEHANSKSHNQINREIILPNEKYAFVKGRHICGFTLNVFITCNDLDEHLLTWWTATHTRTNFFFFLKWFSQNANA